MRPVISLIPLEASAGAAVMNGDIEIASIPPHMCIKWAMILLKASRFAELDVDRVKFEGKAR